MIKSWYQLQYKEANQAEFYNYDASIPVCNPDAWKTAVNNYRESVVRGPDTEWRLVVVSEVIVMSTERTRHNQ